ncbi:MAG TPA: amylo-alpha-1,6-glucosidase [Victivallales bacterium]|nr:amylo-alpha-1,6-glucosidase [Victivallales bacterium]
MVNLTQIPDVGTSRLYFRGDTIQFFLKLSKAAKGKAFLRTNLGRAKTRRKEIVKHVHSKLSISGQDWHDIPLIKISDTEYSISLSLLEVGHFGAMTFILLDGELEPTWPGHDNVNINVEPAQFCCANSIYCAFTRQFGTNKNYLHSKPVEGLTNEDMNKFDHEGFTIIPPSGTFRDLIKELDFIIGELNCRIIHLLPVNPTPTVYARMGRYGSPYASLDFTNIDPSLAEFDKKATPLEQFEELVDEIHRRDAKVIIDVAINHTGWAAKLHEEHPEWLLREDDGTIISPGAWGVTWGDLTELDHTHPHLWEYLADMFLTWTSRGVDGFRCDAGYMIPFEAWEYIISKVKSQYCSTIFLLEGLGGDPKITVDLLNRANMNWAYSELFQNYSKPQIESYIATSHKISLEDGLMVNYAETHDNERLASTSIAYAKMRTSLCALLSDNGSFGFTNGVEWYAQEKIDVHEASALNWGSKVNQIKHIARLNTILIAHQSFYRGAKIKFLNTINENILAIQRSNENNLEQLLILINLDYKKSTELDYKSLDLSDYSREPVYDLISDKKIALSPTTHILKLFPGQALCLSPKLSDLVLIHENEIKNILRPDKIVRQRAKACALSVLSWKNGTNIISGIDTENIEKRLLENPFDFIKNLYPPNTPIPVIKWKWPVDLKRKVIVPFNHILMVTSPYRFRISLLKNKQVIVHTDGLTCSNGEYSVLIIPPKMNLDEHKTLNIKISVFTSNKCQKSKSELLYLAKDINYIKTNFTHPEIINNNSVFLNTNKRGGMTHANVAWGEINSKYNALLAANLDPKVPVDRHVMFTRCRAWVLYQGRSTELKINNLTSFYINIDGGGTWNFHVPIGNGLYIDISISILMHNGENLIRISILRHKADGKESFLSDSKDIHLILRPDIEDRSFHEETKLNDDLKKQWEESVVGFEKGFNFSPSKDRTLSLRSTKGIFGVESEYKYSIYHKIDDERGMDSTGDLFSPGYFNIDLIGGEHADITALAITDNKNDIHNYKNNINLKCLLTLADCSIEKVLLKSIEDFIVKRDNLKTVIAGYPWFLDWGRDTLICVRGLITANKLKDVKDIIFQFAKYIENGTLPNIIHGKTVGNRDTSDAQLWLFTACKDYCLKVGNNNILKEKVYGSKTLLDSLILLAEGYIAGTPNGIKVDKKSKLVFSPSHFTWMDTNYPAGTPRTGYPIEIQALWFYSLLFLSETDNNNKWKRLANKVKKSIKEYFIFDELDENGFKTGRRYLSDCLHCSRFKPASESKADDHIRPNQLFALTLDVIDDLELGASILEICYELIIPGAIRSLADRKTIYKMSITDNGKLLNDPDNPYFGEYTGVENVTRKPAYHNGTAWTWPFPSYCEAYMKIYGPQGKEHAISVLSSSSQLFESGCIEHLPEILDGNFPHREKGCDAQAWGVTEFYRIWKLLHQ